MQKNMTDAILAALDERVQTLEESNEEVYTNLTNWITHNIAVHVKAALEERVKALEDELVIAQRDITKLKVRVKRQESCLGPPAN